MASNSILKNTYLDGCQDKKIQFLMAKIFTNYLINIKTCLYIMYYLMDIIMFMMIGDGLCNYCIKYIVIV